MTATYEKIETQTLASAAASVTFSSIPQTYTDLVIVFSGSATSSNTLFYRFNGDSSGIYSDTYIYADGSAGSGRHTSQTLIYGAGVNTSQCTQIINVMNYTNTTNHKTTLLRGNANGFGATVAFAGLWRSTSAISSIQIYAGSTFASGSTFTIYGIKAE